MSVNKVTDERTCNYDHSVVFSQLSVHVHVPYMDGFIVFTSNLCLNRGAQIHNSDKSDHNYVIVFDCSISNLYPTHVGRLSLSVWVFAV